MKESTAKLLAETGLELGIEVNVRRYSGRGMYGRETTAIVMEHKMGKLLAIVAVASQEFGEGDLFEAFVDDVQGLRFDDMGRDDMVVY